MVLLVLGMWRRTIGIPVLLLWRMFFNLQEPGLYLVGAGPLLSMRWPSLVFPTLASIFSVPGWVVRKLNTLVFKFFWKGKRELVARRVVIQEPRFGGSLLSLLVQWVRRLVTDSPCWVGFSNITLVFVLARHRWTFCRALRCLIRVGCHLFTGISCWHGKLWMVVSRLPGHPWQSGCQPVLFLPPSPISLPSWSTPSCCRSNLLTLKVSLSLCGTLARCIGWLRGNSYFGLALIGPLLI